MIGRFNQLLSLKESILIIASCLGITVDLTMLLNQSKGILSLSIIVTLVVYYLFRPQRPQLERYKLFFCSSDGTPRPDLFVEMPSGRDSTDSGGFVAVSPEVNKLNGDEYEICIFSSEGKLLKREMIVRTNHEPVVVITV